MPYAGDGTFFAHLDKQQKQEVINRVAKEELVLQQPQRLEKLLAALDENEAVQDIFTNCQPW